MAKKVLLIVLVALAVIAAIVGTIFLQDAFLRRQYPLEHEDTIVRYADEYGLDPYFVCAMIDVESDFVEDAVSPDGAQGLMQIMPETSEWIAQKTWNRRLRYI